MDTLSRVRREQRMRGKSSTVSGLRIVMMAAAITVAILLFGFGAVGMLMLARSPQEPITSKLDPAPPVSIQADVPPAAIPQAEAPPPLVLPQPEAALQQSEAETPAARSVKTHRVLAPAPAKDEPVKDLTFVPAPQAEPEPDTTASIPQPQPAQQNPQAVRPRVPQQQHVRRHTPKTDSQSENPLFRLFGIRQYR